MSDARDLIGVGLVLGAVGALAAAGVTRTSGSPARALRTRKTSIPKGTLLYHGTSSPEDFDVLSGPAWVSTSKKVAHWFVDWNASGNRDGEDADKPRILTFRTVKKITGLAEINDDEQWKRFTRGLVRRSMRGRRWTYDGPRSDRDEEVEEQLGGLSPVDLAELACAEGYTGWHLLHNYGAYESDTLLCRPGDWLELVHTQVHGLPAVGYPRGHDVEPSSGRASGSRDVEAGAREALNVLARAPGHARSSLCAVMAKKGARERVRQLAIEGARSTFRAIGTDNLRIGRALLRGAATGSRASSDPYDNAEDRRARLDAARDYPENLLPNLESSGIVPASYMRGVPWREGQAIVTIYRSVPPGVTTIRPGDWVTLERSYALGHDRGGRVLSLRVPAEHVYWAGTDLHEWFYTP